MRSLIRALAIAALVAISALAPVAARANDNVTTLHIKGPLVNAIFSSTDPSGCIQTDMFVTANNQAVRSVEGSGTGYAAVNLYQYDNCTQTPLLSAVGEQTPLPAGELVVSYQLDRATLSGTILVADDVSGSSFPASIDLTWVGTGPVYRNRSFSNELLGGRCRVINHWKGTGRDAVASGSVLVGGTNYMPAPSQSAEIGEVISGSAVMHCG